MIEELIKKYEDKINECIDSKKFIYIGDIEPDKTGTIQSFNCDMKSPYHEILQDLKELKSKQTNTLNEYDKLIKRMVGTHLTLKELANELIGKE